MNVLIVPSWYPTEDQPNAGIFFKEQAKALLSRDINITVAFPEVWSLKKIGQKKPKRGIVYQIEDQIPTYRYRQYNFFPRIARGSTIYYKRLKKLFEQMTKLEGKPDIIHAHSVLWGGWAASQIAREHDIPFVITEHSSAFLRGLIKREQKPFIQETFRCADKVIAVSPALSLELQSYVSKDKLKVIPNVVDISRFKPSGVPRKTMKFRFFSLAFLKHVKGFDLLLSAFSGAFKGNDQVELVIGGDGEKRTALEQQALQLGIQNQVIFLGDLSRDQVANEMQACDVFVLASRFETFGVVFVEALASGKPVIATKCGGPEFIVNKTNGLLCNVNDIGSLEKALIKIHANIDRYDSDQIYNDCINRFGSNTISTQIANVYKSLI